MVWEAHITDPAAMSYYGHARRVIAPLLPTVATRILDLGAGNGATSNWLRECYPNAHFVAAEGNVAVSDTLRKCVDEVHIGDINTMDSFLGSYDLVLMLDILEHLVSPERVLKRIVDRLPAGATVIISLPNVAHLSVAVRLFFLGEFEYEDGGILDRTHLHFYTEDSALQLARSAGLFPTEGVIPRLNSGKYRVANILSAGLFKQRLAFQYIFASTNTEPAKNDPISWRVTNI